MCRPPKARTLNLATLSSCCAIRQTLLLLSPPGGARRQERNPIGMRVETLPMALEGATEIRGAATLLSLRRGFRGSSHVLSPRVRKPWKTNFLSRRRATLLANNLGFGPYSFGGSEGHARSTPIEIRTAASAAIKIKKVGLSSRLARSKVGMLIPQSRCAVQMLVPLEERGNKVGRFKANASGVSGPSGRSLIPAEAGSGPGVRMRDVPQGEGKRKR
jgi:hypothetical protein